MSLVSRSQPTRTAAALLNYSRFLNYSYKRPWLGVRANTGNPLKFLRNTMHGARSKTFAEPKLPVSGRVCLSVMV
jgi:hypothetical protein